MPWWWWLWWWLWLRWHPPAPFLPPSEVRVRILTLSNVVGFYVMTIARVTWKDPTTRVDGVPGKPTEIAYIRVLMSSDSGATWADVGHVGPTIEFYDQTLDAAGTYQFKLQVVDTQSPPTVSADSAVVQITQELAAFNPPSDVGVGFFRGA